MDSQEFLAVASAGRRLSDKSLAIARAILVEHEPVASVAERYGVSPQHANVVRTRFQKRADDVRLRGFMSNVTPAGLTVELELREHASQIQQLNEKGYSAGQIADFLDSLGVTATVQEIKQFLKGLK